ncbi:MAG: DNA-binding response regulator [Anaerolinea sp.]|nr:DNA-binding response regulator [Anaerolinea sp.]
MQPVKTLIADDHALVRAGLRDALNNLPDLEIVGEVSNGPELMSALDNLHPGLLVMDVNMPEFEPVAAVKRILARQPELKILVVSAYDDDSYVTGLLSAGVRGYHLKDQPLSDLQLAVRRILDNGRWISDPLVNRLVQHHTAESSKALELTRRQREFLYLLTQGYNNHKIATLTDLSIKTVENHLTALYRAICVESRLEANKFANEHPELLSPPGLATAHPLKKGDSQYDGSITILLVDDNRRYRAQLGKLLNRAYPSISVHEAEDPADAYRLAEQMKPNLAFVDVVLMEEDGIQCTRRIKAISPATRVILISAYPDREFRRIGMNAGAIAFLDKKDIDAATVRHVIEDAMTS